LEGNDFGQAGHIGIASYGTTWQPPAGNGDNNLNTATICMDSPVAFYVGQKGMGQGRQKLAAVYRYFPNPVTDHITIEHTLQGKVTITVYDLLGRVLIREYHNTPSVVLPTGALQAGVYLLQVADGIHTTTRTFIRK
jgi:hypothetical protein